MSAELALIEVAWPFKSVPTPSIPEIKENLHRKRAVSQDKTLREQRENHEQ
jgi:hypothetical protein